MPVGEAPQGAHSAPEPPDEPSVGGGEAGGGKGIGGMFSEGSTVWQLFVWGVLQQVIVSMLQPGFDMIAQGANKVGRSAVLAPSELADLAARGLYDPDTAAGQAELSGLDRSRFAQLVQLAKGAPAAGDMFDAMFRGLAAWDNEQDGTPSVTEALARSGIDARYFAMLHEVAVKIPSGAEVLNAYLEGQIERPEALERWNKAGNDPTWFQTAYNTNGTAPTPVELLGLYNRHLIPENGTGPEATSYEQGFLEGPWRNKWMPIMFALHEYLPPPRTVTAMVRSGGMDDTEALSLLVKQGLSESLAAAYVHDAHTTASAKDKELTESQVVTLYEDRLISTTDATSMLSAIGYTGKVAEYILTLADVRRAISALNNSVSRVQSLYTGHKITRATAVDALNKLEIPATEVQAIVSTWDITRAVSVKLLTESQTVDAWADGFMTQAQAQAELVAMGYTPHDAWVLMSIKNKAALPGEPQPGPANPLGA